MKMDEMETLSVGERVACFYCAFGVDFIGTNITLPDELIDPSAVPEYLSYLESPNADRWLVAEAALIPFAQGKVMKDEQQRALVNFEQAKINCECLNDAGAVPIFAQHLLRTMQSLKGLNFQFMDIDQLERIFGQLNRALTMLYLVIVLAPESICLERLLFDSGIVPPKQMLADILECVQTYHPVAGFPLKRFMLLIYSWITRVLGDLPRLTQRKNERRIFHQLAIDIPTKPQCKSIKKPIVIPITEQPSDPLYVAKFKAQANRDRIYNKYIHKPHYDLPMQRSDNENPTLDQEWSDRIETMYRTMLLPNAKDYMGLFASVMTAATNPDKRAFSKRSSTGGDSSFEAQMVSPEEQAYLAYILREKAILMDVTSLTLLTILKHARSSHLYKGEYLASNVVDAGVLATLTKFMNRDFATYVQVRNNDDNSLRVEGLPNGNKKATIIVPIDDTLIAEYALQQTRCLASALRLLQRLTKRKPSLIKSTLCRSQSIVWIKRILNLKEPMTRLYALKLVKSQARYLGHQWTRKFTCVPLLTEVYLYVRPELEDDWLRSEDDDTSVTSAPKPIENLLAGEVQAYHNKNYWDRVKPTAAANVTVAVQGMMDLEQEALDVEGGSCRKLLNELQLDAAACQQYEKWLDIQGLVADKEATMPIVF